MIGVSLGVADFASRRAVIGVAPAPTPAPTPTFTDISITGDSITFGTGVSTYADQYDTYAATAFPAKNVHKRAAGSRATGTTANLNDGGNTLFGQLSVDFADGIDIATRFIGANDLQAITSAAYRTRQINYKAAVAAAYPGVKLAWSVPIPYNPDQSQPTYATFTPRRAELMADARNPGTWSQYGDYYLPLGEHPDFADVSIGPTLFQDGVHPNASGQTLLYTQFKAAMDTLLDTARVNSSSPYNAVWPTSEGSLGTSQTITRRFVLSGLAWTGYAGNVSVTGSGSPQVRVNGGAYGANAGQTRIYNGDVVDLQVTLGAVGDYAVNLTIGGETRMITYTAVAPSLPSVQPGTMPRTSDLKLFLRADDVASMFQNNGGTGAITANAQPVGYWADVSGNGFHLTSAANGSARPNFGTDGTLGWLDFDGTDDFLRRLAALDLYGAGAYTVMAAVRVNGTPIAAGRTLVMEGNSADADTIVAPLSNVGTSAVNSAWYRNDTGSTPLAFSTSLDQNGYDNTDNVICITDSGSSVISYTDGTQGVNSPRSYTRSGTVTVNQFAVGGTLRTSFTNPVPFRLSALAIWRGVVLDSTERAQAQTLMKKIQTGL